MNKRLARICVRSLFSCLLVLLTMLFTALPAAAAARTSTLDIGKIDAFLASQVQTHHLPGVALGIVQGNQIVHLRGFGSADPSGRAVTAQTPFLLGSLTKSFTALATMQLVEAGKIDLDAPVQRYLPEFRDADAQASARITVRNLLTMTSGLPTGAGEGPALETETLAQFVRSLRDVTPTAPVGTTFQYCNANYMMLGLLIQVVSGQDYGTYIRQHIFAPLHMSNSFVSAQQAQHYGMAQGYHWAFGIPYGAEDTDLRLHPVLSAGLLISTAEDMTHYLIAQMNGGRYGITSVLSPTGVATMHMPEIATPALGQGSGYSMGWISGPVDGEPAFWHNGETGAFYTYMLIEPQHQVGAILLFNSFGLFVQLAYLRIQTGLADLLAGKTPPASGFSLGTVYLIIDTVIMLISVCVVLSALWLPRWYRRLVGRPRRRILRVALRLFWELVLPAVLIVFVIPSLVGPWPTLLVLVGDLSFWLLTTYVVLLITGLVRVVLFIHVLRMTHVAIAVALSSSGPGPA
jgi:CubicO group peptidase (beta-lactamase class C family)